LRRRFSSGGGSIRSGDAFLIAATITCSPFVPRERRRESSVKKCTVRLIHTFRSSPTARSCRRRRTQHRGCDRPFIVGQVLGATWWLARADASRPADWRQRRGFL